MGETLSLTSAADGFVFGAYRAPTLDARRGGLVLIHDVSGVTDPVRALADGFAEDGYETLAPSLFDRQQRGFEARDSADEAARGPDLAKAAPWGEVAGDLAAAVEALKPPVFVVGYGWGGAATWLAACRCEGVAAASAFYGGRIAELAAETPRCPIILHFGRRDPATATAVDVIAAAHSEIPIHMYDAGHGFASGRQDGDSADAARLSRLRTLQVFAANGGGRGDL